MQSFVQVTQFVILRDQCGAGRKPTVFFLTCVSQKPLLLYSGDTLDVPGESPTLWEEGSCLENCAVKEQIECIPKCWRLLYVPQINQETPGDKSPESRGLFYI